MQRHLRSQIEVTESEVVPDDQEVTRTRDHRDRDLPARPPISRRRSSDPTADRPVVRRQRRGYESPISESEEDVEVLPDRFDAYGAPLDGRDRQNGSRWTSRRGEFQRRPQKHGDWDINGSWHVAGTDGLAVDRLARSFTEALDGRRSWMGVLGEALGGTSLLGQGGREGRDEDSGYESRRRRVR